MSATNSTAASKAGRKMADERLATMQALKGVLNERDMPSYKHVARLTVPELQEVRVWCERTGNPPYPLTNLPECLSKVLPKEHPLLTWRKPDACPWRYPDTIPTFEEPESQSRRLACTEEEPQPEPSFVGIRMRADYVQTHWLPESDPRVQVDVLQDQPCPKCGVPQKYIKLARAPEGTEAFFRCENEACDFGRSNLARGKVVALEWVDGIAWLTFAPPDCKLCGEPTSLVKWGQDPTAASFHEGAWRCTSGKCEISRSCPECGKENPTWASWGLKFRHKFPRDDGGGQVFHVCLHCGATTIWEPVGWPEASGFSEADSPARRSAASDGPEDAQGIPSSESQTDKPNDVRPPKYQLPGVPPKSSSQATPARGSPSRESDTKPCGCTFSGGPCGGTMHPYPWTTSDSTSDGKWQCQKCGFIWQEGETFYTSSGPAPLGKRVSCATVPMSAGESKNGRPSPLDRTEPLAEELLTLSADTLREAAQALPDVFQKAQVLVWLSLRGACQQLMAAIDTALLSATSIRTTHQHGSSGPDKTGQGQRHVGDPVPPRGPEGPTPDSGGRPSTERALIEGTPMVFPAAGPNDFVPLPVLCCDWCGGVLLAPEGTRAEFRGQPCPVLCQRCFADTGKAEG